MSINRLALIGFALTGCAPGTAEKLADLSDDYLTGPSTATGQRAFEFKAAAQTDRLWLGLKPCCRILLETGGTAATTSALSWSDVWARPGVARGYAGSNKTLMMLQSGTSERPEVPSVNAYGARGVLLDSGVFLFQSFGDAAGPQVLAIDRTQATSLSGPTWGSGPCTGGTWYGNGTQGLLIRGDPSMFGFSISCLSDGTSDGTFAVTGHWLLAPLGKKWLTYVADQSLTYASSLELLEADGTSQRIAGAGFWNALPSTESGTSWLTRSDNGVDMVDLWFTNGTPSGTISVPAPAWFSAGGYAWANGNADVLYAGSAARTWATTKDATVELSIHGALSLARTFGLVFQPTSTTAFEVHSVRGTEVSTLETIQWKNESVPTFVLGDRVFFPSTTLQGIEIRQSDGYSSRVISLLNADVADDVVAFIGTVSSRLIIAGRRGSQLVLLSVEVPN
jgi:hypothetical protein